MNHQDKLRKTGVSRRNFLGGAAGAAALGFTQSERLYAGSESNTIPVPVLFPNTIPLYQQTFKNWSEEIVVNNVWTCCPKTSQDVATLANWAAASGFRLRAVGASHGFAPLVLPRGSNGANFVLVSMMDHMNGITVNPASSSVTAQTGASLENIAAACSVHGLGFLHTPAPGNLSLGGALAINGHGASLPSLTSKLAPGHTHGSLSNLVLSLTAVIWDEGSKAYVLKTFQRNDPGIGPLLAHIGRAFITDVTLQMGPDLKTRCVSCTNIPISTILCAPGNAGPNSYSALLDKHGAAEVIWFPFAGNNPWVKTWDAVPVKPAHSMAVSTPYNYPFSDSLPAVLSDLISWGLRVDPSGVPGFNQTASSATVSGLANGSSDIWGSAYCTTFYIKPSSLREAAASWAVLISRQNIQRALNEFYVYLTNTIQAYKSKGQYPYCGAVELRAQGLENPADVLMPGAVEPYLSAIRPSPAHPDYDAVVWFDINNIVDLPCAGEFFNNLEQWFLTNYGSYAIVRPEWSKTWGFSPTGPYNGGWSNKTLLTETYPNTFRDGYQAGVDDWDAALATLDSYDPKRIFTNPLLDVMMP